MKATSVLAVLLSCVTICAAAKGEKSCSSDGVTQLPCSSQVTALLACSLTGQWKNDLGSNMTISAISDEGEFSGAYLTSVSATNKTILTSPVIGYQQLNGSPTFGFIVKWSFTSSISVFAGQCFINKTGQPTLQTTWLLRSESGDIKDNWSQTRVGCDIFYKLPSKLN
ncbi:avidin-like isoform X1 [Bufo bufo]|uniref:avidin-like isoform X1 n=1 Tax=Bufo bufo TaxID=8384 RepID=UPI001ABEB341|nr:avidin-like isoform X1 [Bufo bufo]